MGEKMSRLKYVWEYIGRFLFCILICKWFFYKIKKYFFFMGDLVGFLGLFNFCFYLVLICWGIV